MNRMRVDAGLRAVVVSLYAFAASVSGTLAAKAEYAQSVVPLRDSGERARVEPHIDEGYIRVDMIGSDGRPSGTSVVVPLRNQVVPEIGVTITSTDDGKFHFQYSVRNGKSAKQRVNNWDLVLPASAAVGRTVQPKFWNSATVVSRISQVAHGLDGASSGAILSWYRSLDAAAFITPGETLSGFALDSLYTPGIVYSYTFGEWPDDSALARLPSEIVRALLPYISMEHQSQPRITVGPFFAPGTPARVIVSSYRSRLTSAPPSARAGMRELFLRDISQLLANAEHAMQEQDRFVAALNVLCKFCEARDGSLSENAIRQGIYAAVCRASTLNAKY